MNNFKEIRKKPNFLYLFFLEKGGRRVKEGEFNNSLNIWLHSKGLNPFIGRKQIEKFLDSKYA